MKSRHNCLGGNCESSFDIKDKTTTATATAKKHTPCPSIVISTLIPQGSSTRRITSRPLAPTEGAGESGSKKDVDENDMFAPCAPPLSHPPCTPMPRTHQQRVHRGRPANLDHKRRLPIGESFNSIFILLSSVRRCSSSYHFFFLFISSLFFIIVIDSVRAFAFRFPVACSFYSSRLSICPSIPALCCATVCKLVWPRTC
ncbi:hypothetical protein EDD21DRAFT_393310 [Dissophora ornata]|nr:hypothetical protein EDD21DRAFT_393310 [Dissophora ornata]